MRSLKAISFRDEMKSKRFELGETLERRLLSFIEGASIPVVDLEALEELQKTPMTQDFQADETAAEGPVAKKAKVGEEVAPGEVPDMD